MKKLTKYKTVLAGLLVVLIFGSWNTPSEWMPLLDSTLYQWDTYLSYRHAQNYNGDLPRDETGRVIQPIGYNIDPENVFSVREEHGEPVLRISGEVYGCIFTTAEYENYHLRLKTKWGSEKYVPRVDKLKDSGILYHSIGESGVDYWRAWMLSQEFQIMEGHMGDYWNISTSIIDIRAFLPEGQMNSVASVKQPFLPFGSSRGEQGFCMRSNDRESKPGEWTTLELICFKDKSLHIVNGEVVMVLKNSAYTRDGKIIPLTKGKIQLQSEAAEVFFKDIEIKSIAEVPAKYAALF
jgi:hypothetical protein